ncbi:major facilitator superfamily domain-containing protein [Aspergillus filifer]
MNCCPSRDQLNRTETYSSFGNSSSDDASSTLDGVDRLVRTQTAQTQPGYGLERHPTAPSRVATKRSQHSATVGTLKTRTSRKPLPEEKNVVEFVEPDDPMHPQNWPTRKKIMVSALLAFTTFNSTLTSSIFSAANSVVSAKFGVSTEVGALGMPLYVLGFAFGPTLFSPMSELIGRRLPILIGVFGFTVFQLAVATAENLQTVIICRFFGGFFGACPMAVVTAVFSDLYDNRHRGFAITIFTMMVFTGPLFAPFIGGFNTESYLGWCWTVYLTEIMGAAAFVLDIFFVGETYSPVIDLAELIGKNFSRPVRILFKKLVLLLLSIYMAFLYGSLYLFITAYPIVFQQIHGFNKGVDGLPYFGLIIGEILGGLFIIATQPWYNRKLAANNDIPIPEWRLPPAIIGAAASSWGLFWFGWTGYQSSTPWIIPTVSGLLTGFGLPCIFLQCMNYIIDTYHMFASSALAANSVLRSTADAGFPLFAPYMFNALGVNYTVTLLGCVAAVLTPIPLLFYLHGSKIRPRSKFAAEYTVAAKSHDKE